MAKKKKSQEQQGSKRAKVPAKGLDVGKIKKTVGDKKRDQPKGKDNAIEVDRTETKRFTGARNPKGAIRHGCLKQNRASTWGQN